MRDGMEKCDAGIPQDKTQLSMTAVNLTAVILICVNYETIKRFRIGVPEHDLTCCNLYSSEDLHI